MIDLLSSNSSIIKHNQINSEQNDWKSELKTMVKTADELFNLLNLSSEWLTKARIVEKIFPVRVTKSYLSRIRIGDLNDPLLRQILPIDAELVNHPNYTIDPLAEKNQSPIPGIIHKYYGRALVILSSACAIHCRYCFRRSFPYDEHRLTPTNWQPILNYFQQDSSLTEIILSGGDPLTLNDNVLYDFFQQLNKIRHIKRVRIHTRLPIVAPSRLTNNLLILLKNLTAKPTIVIHCNHAQELSKEVLSYISIFQKADIPILNQAVLLKGVNSNSETLIELAEKLWEYNIRFYYLHLLDRVQGAAHFDVNPIEAKSIYKDILAKLPGYMVPRLVQEIPHANSKIDLNDLDY